jgi:hypothetical protein
MSRSSEVSFSPKDDRAVKGSLNDLLSSGQGHTPHLQDDSENMTSWRLSSAESATRRSWRGRLVTPKSIHHAVASLGRLLMM